MRGWLPFEEPNAIGPDASAIDRVLITHMHPDHVGGLIDADDQLVFPQARVLVPAGELDYWRGDIPEGASGVLPRQFQAANRELPPVFNIPRTQAMF